MCKHGQGAVWLVITYRTHTVPCRVHGFIGAHTHRFLVACMGVLVHTHIGSLLRAWVYWCTHTSVPCRVHEFIGAHTHRFLVACMGLLAHTHIGSLSRAWVYWCTHTYGSLSALSFAWCPPWWNTRYHHGGSIHHRTGIHERGLL